MGSIAMRREFHSSFGGGFGFALGACLAIVTVAGGVYGYFYLAQPLSVIQTPRTVGTSAKAKQVALGAMRKHAISDLSKETKAIFDDRGQWVIFGQAKSDAGKLVEVSATVNVATIDGTLHWRVTFLEIDGKGYLGK